LKKSTAEREESFAKDEPSFAERKRPFAKPEESFDKPRLATAYSTANLDFAARDATDFYWSWQSKGAPPDRRAPSSTVAQSFDRFPSLDRP
jgi:hypothetical protein